MTALFTPDQTPDGPILTVVHLGPLDSTSGGIAGVARRQLAWNLPTVGQRALATTRGGGPRSDLRLLPRAIFALIALTRRRPALVHVHLSQGGSFVREGLLICLARTLRVPVAIQLHGSNFVAFASRHPTLVKLVLERAGVIFCLTSGTQRLVRELVGPERHVVLIHNAEDAPPTGARERQRLVLFAGVVGARKGVDTLLEAWASLGPDLLAAGWRLDLCGPLDEDWKGRPMPPLPTNVIWSGAQPHDRVMERLSCASIAVLPSRAEAFPMFLVEAMARAVVPVSSDVGDVARLVGGAGKIVPSGSVEQLASALSELMRLPPEELERRGGEARLRLADQFGTRRLRESVEEGWRKCLQ